MNSAELVKCDLVPADVAERGDFVDFKLMNRIAAMKQPVPLVRRTAR